MYTEYDYGMRSGEAAQTMRLGNGAGSAAEPLEEAERDKALDADLFAAKRHNTMLDLMAVALGMPKL